MITFPPIYVRPKERLDIPKGARYWYDETPGQPWDVTLKVDPDNPNGYVATVNPGLIGGILPSNWDEEFSVGTGLSYMVVECQSDGRVVTAATISNETTIPDPQDPALNTAPDTVKILFAVIKDGLAIRTLKDGHIAINPVLTTSENTTSITPGLSVVDRYYVWGLL